MQRCGEFTASKCAGICTPAVPANYAACVFRSSSHLHTSFVCSSNSSTAVDRNWDGVTTQIMIALQHHVYALGALLSCLSAGAQSPACYDSTLADLAPAHRIRHLSYAAASYHLQEHDQLHQQHALSTCELRGLVGPRRQLHGRLRQCTAGRLAA
jgi:hypothetical protein